MGLPSPGVSYMMMLYDDARNITKLNRLRREK
jgi:hypothetical protein